MSSSAEVHRPDAHVHFGVFFQGVNHTTIWSDPASGSQMDFETFRHMITTAERGTVRRVLPRRGPATTGAGRQVLDLDIAGRPDAIAQLSALAASPRTSVWSPRRTPRTTNREIWPGVWQAWTFSRGVGRGGIPSPPTTHGPGRTSAAAACSTTNSGTNGPESSFAPPTPSGIRGPTMPLRPPPTASSGRFRMPHGTWTFRRRSSTSRSIDGAPQPAGSSGRLPGRRFADGPRLRGGQCRCHLLGSRHTLRRRARLRQRHPRAAGRGGQAVGRHQDPAGDPDRLGRNMRRRWRTRGAGCSRVQYTGQTALSLVGLVWGRDLSDRDPDGPLPDDDPLPAPISVTRGAARDGKDRSRSRRSGARSRMPRTCRCARSPSRHQRVRGSWDTGPGRRRARPVGTRRRDRRLQHLALDRARRTGRDRRLAGARTSGTRRIPDRVHVDDPAWSPRAS